MSNSSISPGILTINVESRDALYAAYMPFVKGGGLFYETSKMHRLGDEVFMLLTLPGSQERIPVAARVIWITPRGSQGKRPQGVGLQFSPDDKGETQRKIEAVLGERLGASQPTNTL